VCDRFASGVDFNALFVRQIYQAWLITIRRTAQLVAFFVNDTYPGDKPTNNPNPAVSRTTLHPEDEPLVTLWLD